MPSFICKVLTPQGQIVKIKMVEDDKITCLKKLKKNGMTPINVEQHLEISSKKTKKVSANIYSKRNNKIKFNLNKTIILIDKIKSEEIIKFTR